MSQPTVLLGMSGGVDSSVAASLLVAQGYRVSGITLQVWEHEDESVAASKRWQERGCCKVGLARFVAQRLGITHEVVDIRERFRRGVIDDFVAGYLAGTTPNPCVRCNERVKIKELIDLAAERGIDYVATGHYARIIKGSGGLELHCANDARKDQSYFLYRLQQSWLPKILFPVGHMQKADVWTAAGGLELPADELKESQEICFVSHGDYRSFLAQEAPDAHRPGDMVDVSGRTLGRHDGIAFFTPGQRRGLGVATGERLYVQRVDPASNLVVLGDDDALYQAECLIADLNLLDDRMLTDPQAVTVKIRYATPPTPATIERGESAWTIRVRFASPQRALSPGQSAVFYDGSRVVGGGIIQSSHP
ncbi:MAG: tRNA 2-thiouridine(34) synthase MnmA [Nitrospiraceae bacterium]